MFGLLKVDFDQSVNGTDIKKYQAHYCALCHALSKEYGQLSRLAANYEATLIYLFFSKQNREGSVFTKKIFCPVNIGKKESCDINEDTMADTMAEISIVLAYEKMIDDEYDDKKKLLGFIRSRVIKKYDKASSRLKEKNFDVQYLKNLMDFQRKLEAAHIHSFQKTSEPTALMLEYIFNFLSDFLFKITPENKPDKALYKEIGYQLGKWIYMADSIIDFEEDSFLRQFNPIILKCGFFGANGNMKLYNIPGSIKSEIKKELSAILEKLKTSIKLLSSEKNNQKNYSLIKYILTTNLKRKTDIMFNAMDNNSKPDGNCVGLLQQASIAGVISTPKLVFASNGLDQICGSCVGPVLMCAILYYAFKTMLGCNRGNTGSCCPCNADRPGTVQVEDGCGGQKTYKRDCDGKYRDQSSCC